MSTFVETDHPRARKGTFAEKLQSDPEVWLTGQIPNPTAMTNINFAEGIRSTNPRIARAAAAALFANARVAVTSYGERRGLSDADIQDAVSDALISLNEYVRNGRAVSQGLVQVRAVTIVSQYMNGPIRHETARALKLLAARTAAAESALGRPISDEQIDALALAVRDTFDPLHRPAVGFHREDARPAVNVTNSELIEMESDGSLKRGAPVPYELPLVRDRFEEMLDIRRSPKEGKYTLYAQAAGLPEPSPQSLTPGQADFLVKMYSQDIPRIASKFSRGDASREEADILFAPFANATANKRDDIATAFANQADFASRLWASAVETASRIEEKTKQKMRFA